MQNCIARDLSELLLVLYARQVSIMSQASLVERNKHRFISMWSPKESVSLQKA